jgi:hypothetical protein
MTLEEWEVCAAAIQCLRAAACGSCSERLWIGGTHRRWRNTKDIDFYILRAARIGYRRAQRQPFADYHEKLAYDRGWIYRSTRSGLIVDVIWGTPNRRTQVDEDWFQHAPTIQLRTERVGVMPAEELLWTKLYVLQRDRCDWPDLINLLYATSGSLNWDRLVAHLEDDLALLTGLLAVFSGLVPTVSATSLT